MNKESEWVPVARYAAAFQAEFAEATLQSAGIPVLIKGRESGIWGPGFAGPTSQGLSVWVPAEHQEEARQLIAPADEVEDESLPA